MDSDTQLFIDGQWRPGRGTPAPVLNPANEETIGSHAVADKADLDDAVAAALRGFAKWRNTSAFERSKVMRKAADILRERNESVARAMTLEQGKPLAESRMEAAAGADVIDWLAEEGRRAYGRIVPGRHQCQPDGGQGTGRPGRGLLTLEFSDQSSGSQDFRGACGGMLDHHQGP
jgi:succinate-semialdehyde dehydrogenase/glutarate-semialdehyde dehydrogenase